MVSIEIKGEAPEDVVNVIRGLGTPGRRAYSNIVKDINDCGKSYADYIRDAFRISSSDEATRDSDGE